MNPSPARLLEALTSVYVYMKGNNKEKHQKMSTKSKELSPGLSSAKTTLSTTAGRQLKKQKLQCLSIVGQTIPTVYQTSIIGESSRQVGVYLTGLLVLTQRVTIPARTQNLATVQKDSTPFILSPGLTSATLN